MKIQSITIKPQDSGVTVRVSEESKPYHDHAFTRGAEAIDFISALMAAHDRKLDHKEKGAR